MSCAHMYACMQSIKIRPIHLLMKPRGTCFEEGKVSLCSQGVWPKEWKVTAVPKQVKGLEQ